MTDVYPKAVSYEKNKELLIVKPIFKKENKSVLVRTYYKAKNNRELINRIYNDFLVSAIEFVINGKGAITMPEYGQTSKICIDYKPSSVLKRRDLNSFKNNRQMPLLVLKPSGSKMVMTKTNIYISEIMYNMFVQRFEAGKKFSNIPFSYKVLLPALYEKYHYIEPVSISRIIRYLQTSTFTFVRNSMTVEFNPYHSVYGKIAILFFRYHNTIGIDTNHKKAKAKYEAKVARYAKIFGNRKKKNEKADQ